MSKRFGRVQTASALVPLALLSAAWTASLTGLGTGTAAATDSQNSQDTGLPAGTVLPSKAVEAPASVTSPDSASGGDRRPVSSSSGVSGIPAEALTAYQRAETVINRADPACHLPWQLLAAIGKVESDHGRAQGNMLGEGGIASPGIYGLPLNGKSGTSAITDTDAGQYDGDTSWDRAVGPMQFIPSTWSMVGVDADADGKRDPQDVHDAALATAVYLCSGSEDLGTEAGQRTAVYRYNHSNSYVNTVLATMRAYRSGDFTSVPNNTVPSGDVIYAAPPAAPPSERGSSGDVGASNDGPTTGVESQTEPQSQPTSPTPAPEDQQEATPPPAVSGSGSSHSGSGGSGSDPSPAPEVKTPVKDTLTNTTQQTTKVLASVAELSDICVQELTTQFGRAPAEAVRACIRQLDGKTVPEATDAVAGIVDGLAGLVGDILCGVTGLIGIKCP